jgi:protease I
MVSTNGQKKVRVGILVENNVEDSEWQIPYTALSQAGVDIAILGSRMNDEYKGKQGKVTIQPNATATEVRAEDFDAIVIPGGAAPDRIRTNPNAVSLIADAMDKGIVVAAVCHGPQVLIEADRLRGKNATGFSAIRRDMENAGANYANQPIVVDGNLITSRQPGDLAMFATAILDALGLPIENKELPDITNHTYHWWQLAEVWGGSTRNDIVNALNATITGEHYTSKTFEHYAEHASDPEMRSLFTEIANIKKQNLSKLETRLAEFNEKPSWQAAGGKAFANVQNLFQSDDDVAIIRRALGEIQTGIIDTVNLATQLTDPTTVSVLMEIEAELSKCERRLSEVYRARLGKNPAPPIPTAVTLGS